MRRPQTFSKKNRVCVTGIGLVSPLGLDREATWQGVVAGKSGAAPITQFDASTWPTKFACEVKGFELPRMAMPEELRILLNRPTEFGAAAALEAMIDAGFYSSAEQAAFHDCPTGVDPERFGVSIGSGIGAVSPHRLAKMLAGSELTAHMSDLNANLERAFHQQGEVSRGGPIVLQNHPGTLAALLSARWGARGPATTIHTACASSGQSVGQAYLQIARGEADMILAGGSDSLAGELLLAGFCLLGALSKRNDDPASASRPFDSERDGFVASEGAAMLVLESFEHARSRGACIYAEICGYGETESAYRITDLPENGRGIVEAMTLAVEDSELDFSDFDHVNAHGTSTELNDRVEALAVRRVFSARGVFPGVTSTKSEVGHLISAAGAMETAFTVMAIRDGVIPPTRNLVRSDCGDDVNFVAGEARRGVIRAALSNSVGFGGTNSVVAVRRI